jgi:hypothetical protein
VKTLTALILVLASLSTVQAVEDETDTSVTVRLPVAETITVALVDDALPPVSECKAVCMLPASFD